MSEQAGPEQMRAAMTDYVRAVHRAYLDAAGALPPGDRGRLPLFTAEPFTVAVVGTRYLHILATGESLPSPVGPEVSLDDELDDLRWTVRFYDPVVSPGLGMIDESGGPAPELVRETLGIRSVLYHLSVPPGGGLTPHHAQHAGTGLAHSQSAADRDFTSMTQLRPRSGALVAEMYQAHINQMPVAMRLLANELAGRSLVDPDVVDLEEIRRATLQEIRESSR